MQLIFCLYLTVGKRFIKTLPSCVHAPFLDFEDIAILYTLWSSTQLIQVLSEQCAITLQTAHQDINNVDSKIRSICSKSQYKDLSEEIKKGLSNINYVLTDRKISCIPQTVWPVPFLNHQSCLSDALVTCQCAWLNCRSRGSTFVVCTLPFLSNLVYI